MMTDSEIHGSLHASDINLGGQLGSCRTLNGTSNKGYAARNLSSNSMYALCRMTVTALWHVFFAAVAGIVSVKASQVIALIEPAGLRRVVVLRPPGMVPGGRSRSLHHTLDHSQDRRSF